jgi:hypothetical protein
VDHQHSEIERISVRLTGAVALSRQSLGLTTRGDLLEVLVNSSCIGLPMTSSVEANIGTRL